MNKNKRKRIETQNTSNIDNKINMIEVDELVDDLDRNLVDYLSLALRNTHYYGNLSTKYVSFNFTFNAFFASILAIFIAITVNFNFSLWYIGLPIIIGLVLYFVYFLLLLIVKFDTISFEIYHLQHYKSIMDIDDYPCITKEDEIQNLLDLILKKNNNVKKEQNDKKKKRTSLDLVKNDLKALILQYLYQTNYNRVALIMRNCLIFGSLDLVLSMITSFLMLVSVDPSLFEYRVLIILVYSILVLITLGFVIKNSKLGLKANRS